MIGIKYLPCTPFINIVLFFWAAAYKAYMISMNIRVPIKPENTFSNFLSLIFVLSERYENIKITTPEDLLVAESFLQRMWKQEKWNWERVWSNKK